MKYQIFLTYHNGFGELLELSTAAEVAEFLCTLEDLSAIEILQDGTIVSDVDWFDFVQIENWADAKQTIV
jgi:hypothetical protein